MARLGIDMTIFDHDSTREPARFFSPQVAEARRFFFGFSGTSKGLSVVGGGFERVDRQYLVHRHRFPFLALEFVAGGRGTATLHGRALPLTPGTLFTYSPRVEHRIATDENEPLAKYFIDLGGAASRRLMQRLKLADGHAWQTSRPVEMLRLFDEIIHHGTSGLPAARTICDRLCEALLLHVSQTQLPLGTGEMVALGTYQRCCQVIDSQAMSLRSMAEVAKACRLDPAYICRLFRRFERRSPYQRLVQVRMNHAAARLRAGQVLIKEVAAEMGYDPFHFSRVFKRVFGCSPETMRQMR